MLFNEVIGQTAVKQRLIRAASEGRISHAQLFLGREGSGNLALALAYAQYVMCRQPSATDACGTCSSCVKVQKLVHPDLHFSFPVNVKENSKVAPVSDTFIDQWRQALRKNPYITEQEWYRAIELDEKKQGAIRVEEADRIAEKLLLKSFEGGYKVLLMWLPERMNATVANKLLKLIEEPPAKTLLLLVAQNEERLLKTILSRTQLVSLPPVEHEALADMLRREQHLPMDEAAQLAHVANGSVVRARSLVVEDNGYHREHYEYFVALMRHCYYSSPRMKPAKRGESIVELLRHAAAMAAHGREYQKSFLLYAMQMLRENFAMNRGATQAVYLWGEEAAWSTKFCPFINPNNVERLYAEFNRALQHIGQNGSAKVVMADLALKVAGVIRN